MLIIRKQSGVKSETRATRQFVQLLRALLEGIHEEAVVRYNRSLATMHISEEEAVRDFAAVLERIRAGEEILIEKDARPMVVLRPAEAGRCRLLSESIALAEAHGSTATLDENFSRDLEAIVNSHREPLGALPLSPSTG